MVDVLHLSAQCWIVLRFPHGSVHHVLNVAERSSVAAADDAGKHMAPSQAARDTSHLVLPIFSSIYRTCAPSGCVQSHIVHVHNPFQGTPFLITGQNHDTMVKVEQNGGYRVLHAWFEVERALRRRSRSVNNS